MLCPAKLQLTGYNPSARFGLTQQSSLKQCLLEGFVFQGLMTFCLVLPGKDDRRVEMGLKDFLCNARNIEPANLLDRFVAEVNA